jgi:superfamily I DNA/RNA helicase
MDWSTYQTDVFDHVEKSDKNLEIQAVAGSGKTTTVLSALSGLDKNDKVLYLAFNKSVATYADNRLSSIKKSCKVSSKTFHAHGLHMLKKYGGNPELNKTKVKDYFEKHHDWMKKKSRRWNLIYEAAFGLVSKIRLLGILHLSDAPQWVVDTFCFNIDEEDYKDLLETVEKSLADLDDNTDEIDFDDMIRIPVLRGFFSRNGKWDVLVVDEAQDLNQAQIEMIKQLGRKCKVVYVGDRYQAIYGFRGSDEKSMDRLSTLLVPEVKKLPISYRVPSNITDFVRTRFPKIEIFSHQQGGEIITAYYDIVETVRTHDVHFLLSATNRTLVNFWFDLLSSRIKSTFKDKDVLAVVRKWLIANIEPGTKVDDIYEMAKKKLGKRMDTMLLPLIGAFTSRLKPDQTVEDFQKILDKMEEQSGVELHTIHSAKGLESDTVLVVDNDWFSNTQLDNMQYVAYTRALEKLILFQKSSNTSSGFDW